MKLAIAFSILLTGCSVVADTHGIPQPTGEQVFDLLLSNAGLALTEEPFCDVQSASRESASITLGQHLATVLSVSYDTRNLVQISSTCAETKYESAESGLKDAWDCRLEVLEKSPAGEFVSSSLIAFSADMGSGRFVSGSLRCI